MNKTIYRTSFCLTENVKQQLNELAELFGESRSTIIKLALEKYYLEKVKKHVRR